MKKSNVLTYLILAVLFFLLREPFHEIWYGLRGIGLLQSVTPSKLNDLAALVLTVLGIPGMVLMAKNLSVTGRRWSRILTGCAIYILVVERICFGDTFTPFETLPCLRYADIMIPILISLWLASLEVTQADAKDDNSCSESRTKLLVDDCHEDDFMGRTTLVNDIWEQLKDHDWHTNGALGVAITGGWGTGKTWMMTHLRDKLEHTGKICIEFKPWLYGEADITRRFYLSLDRQLALNGMQVGEIKSAVAEIDNDNMVGLGRALLSFAGIVTKHKGREAAIDRIKNRLKVIQRPIYIFIDDCDRLAHDELLQVLSLIRNTGDFPYLTYIMSFSDKIVSKTIENEEGIHYVAKMFNLTFALPPITDVVIADFLHQAVCRLTDSKPEETENAFKRVKITDYLGTVREAKKYYNLLIADYRSLEDRFNKYYVRFGDFCLLELLKYCYADVYYSPRASVSTYLELAYEGWNSPAYKVKKDVLKDNEKAKRLLEAVFGVVKDPRDPEDIIGVSNSEYTPIYFNTTTNRKYISAEEVNDALEKRDFPNRIPSYVASGLSGVMGMLGAIHSTMSRQQVFESMINYIWAVCEKDKSVNSLSLISKGYHGQPWKHSYKNIRRLMGVTPQIQLITFQRLSSFDDASEENEKDSMDNLIDTTEYPLELMAIWLEELKTVTDSDYPFEDVDYYIKKIWNRLLSEMRDTPEDTLNMIEILGDCSQEDTFEQKVMPLVTENPRRWLGATAKQLKHKDIEYYVLKTRETHSLFGSQSRMVEELRCIKEAVKDEDKAYVEAYEHLANRLAAMILHKDDATIDEKYKSPECIQVSELSELATSQFVGTEIFQPIEDAIKQISEKPFWTGKNLRMQRKDPGYYFGTEI